MDSRTEVWACRRKLEEGKICRKFGPQTPLADKTGKNRIGVCILKELYITRELLNKTMKRKIFLVRPVEIIIAR